ncbi:MAG: EAL domain-containing protein, partial [Hyphomicrobium sp.]
SPYKHTKIDRAFVKDLESSEQARAVLETIVSLAKTLGMRTTAEGVETREQLRIVEWLGCSEVQGYLFCKPLPCPELERYLMEHPKYARSAA